VSVTEPGIKLWQRADGERAESAESRWHNTFKRPLNDYSDAIGYTLMVVGFTAEQLGVFLMIAGFVLIDAEGTARNLLWSNPETPTPEEGLWSGAVGAGAWIYETRDHAQFPVWLRGTLYLATAIKTLGFVGLVAALFRDDQPLALAAGLILLGTTWCRYAMFRLLFRRAARDNHDVAAWVFGRKA
jgi:hypothetical protein